MVAILNLIVLCQFDSGNDILAIFIMNDQKEA